MPATMHYVVKPLRNLQERQRLLDLRVLLVRVMEALLSNHAALSSIAALQENAASLLRRSGATASSDPWGLADVQLLSWLLNAQVQAQISWRLSCLWKPI